MGLRMAATQLSTIESAQIRPQVLGSSLPQVSFLEALQCPLLPPDLLTTSEWNLGACSATALFHKFTRF